MPALRTLVGSRASVFVSRLLSLNACWLDAQGRSCHSHVASGKSSILRSASDETSCGQFAESYVMYSAPGNDGFELQPCRPHATPLVHSHACKQHLKVPESLTRKLHSACEDTSPDDHSTPIMQTHTTQGLETFGSTVPQTLKPCVRQNARSHDAVPSCNADNSAFAPASNSKDIKCLYSPRPSQIPHISVRSKGKQKSQHAAALHQKLCPLELEHVSHRDTTILGRSRALKSTTFGHLEAVLKVLKESLGSCEKAAQALAANPRLLSQPIEVVEQKLKVMADIGITEVVIRKLWTCNKHPLPLKVESLHKKLSFFKENGLNVEALNRLLYNHPGVLGRSSEGSILHIVNFLKSFGMGQRDFLRLVWMYPASLMVSLDNLRAKHDFFKQLGFPENKHTKFICAGLYQYSTEKFQVKAKLLKDQGFSDSDVNKLISMQPAILKVNLETLKSKLDFLLCKQKYSTADIVKAPACVVCSLQG